MLGESGAECEWLPDPPTELESHCLMIAIWSVMIAIWTRTRRFTLVLWIVAVAASASHRLAADETPLWKMGISTWNGEGDDGRPATPQPEPDSTSGAEIPYTVPVDPNETRAPTRAAVQADLREQHSWDPAIEELLPDSPASSGNSSPDDTGVPELTYPLVKTVGHQQSSVGVEVPMADVIRAAENAPIDQPPLEEEVVRWYQYPQRWMRGWDSHAEFGIDGSDGNARTLAVQTGLEMKRKTDAYTLAIDVDYRQASNRNATTEDNGRFNLDYDRLLGESPWAGFGKFGLEWDKFKAFNLRVNLNGGLAYHWIREDQASLVTRFGAGASREIGAPVEEWIAEAVFGIEAERQLTARQKLKGKVDYFPAWEDFGNYRIVTDLAWETLLDGSENLSLKLAVTDRYDSTPQGAEPNDIYYSLLLLYKF